MMGGMRKDLEDIRIENPIADRDVILDSVAEENIFCKVTGICNIYFFSYSYYVRFCCQ